MAGVGEASGARVRRIAVRSGAGPPRRTGYSRRVWLVSPRTALAALSALVGIVVLRGLTDVPAAVAVVAGAVGGWLFASLLVGGAADRLDRALHRMGGPRGRRTRRR